jgi:D-sedoheptulose 7-phosphate isomerase
MSNEFTEYFATLGSLPGAAEASDRNGPVPLANALSAAIDLARSAHARGRKLMFIGNGGSAAIASHMATDYSKNGGMRSLSFNDGAVLTCLGNDYGYEHVFAKQLEFHAVEGDLLIAISSSGRSPNILRAVDTARTIGCRIVTLSSFGADNPLRRLGDLNLYVATSAYGFAEISHLALCHAILDRAIAAAGAGAATSINGK